jgi:outer membrane protein TolC
VQQARDRLDAALKLVTLARQVHEMQHQKFTLALATVEDVITAQRNLAAAQSHVVIARAIYARTLIQYELATGTLLDRHNIALSEAIDGDVHRVPTIPGTPERPN